MRSNLRVLLSVIFLTGLSLGAVEAQAKSKSSAASREAAIRQSYEQRLEELEQKQKILERNLELKEETEKEKAKEKPVVKAGTGGISISSADGNNELRIRGLIQADARFYLDRDNQGAVNTFILRRVRPYIEGKFAKRFEFRIMPDFGEGKVVLQDAWINTVLFPELKIQLGKYKEPVGLERLESASALHFVERGLPTELAPNRDLGVMLNGEILGGVLSYQAGVFNGVPDGASADFDINNSKDFAGRVFAHPFKKTSIAPLQGLGVGVSGTIGQGTGNLTDTQLPVYKTAGRQTWFNYISTGPTTAIANGERWRISPQGYYYYKGFGLLGEYIVTSQNVLSGASQANIKNQAWQIAANYVIGADNSFGNIKPRKPLGWKKGGTGAFEFGARYNEAKIDPEAFPIFADPNKSASKAKNWGVAFNWIINDNAKLYIDFEQTRFEGGGAGGTNRKTENVILNRYQLNF